MSALPESGTLVRWVGIDRYGNAHTGSSWINSPSSFIAMHFRAGWKRFTLKVNGETIGEIRKNADGVRTWWSE